VELVAMLKIYLEQEGFGATTTSDGITGTQYVFTGEFDIVVLDVMMPKIGGIETLRRIRAQSKIPIIMLTAKGDNTDRILGLELGADDYVTKPCTPRELVARIRAILRRVQDVPDSISPKIVVGLLSLWPEQRRVELAGAPLDLTSTEFTLLEVLIKNAGQVVSKEYISENIFSRPYTRFDRNIDVHMSSIRQKVGNHPDDRPFIQTVYKLGYQLVKE
ncbi:MAG TPA: response regulator transcription factor, partial [Methyloradius sp.]